MTDTLSSSFPQMTSLDLLANVATMVLHTDDTIREQHKENDTNHMDVLHMSTDTLEKCFSENHFDRDMRRRVYKCRFHLPGETCQFVASTKTRAKQKMVKHLEGHVRDVRQRASNGVCVQPVHQRRNGSREGQLNPVNLTPKRRKRSGKATKALALVDHDYCKMARRIKPVRKEETREEMVLCDSEREMTTVSFTSKNPFEVTEISDNGNQEFNTFNDNPEHMDQHESTEEKSFNSLVSEDDDEEVAGLSQKQEKQDAILNARVVIKRGSGSSSSEDSYYPSTDSEFSPLVKQVDKKESLIEFDASPPKCSKLISPAPRRDSEEKPRLSSVEGKERSPDLLQSKFSAFDPIVKSEAETPAHSKLEQCLRFGSAAAKHYPTSEPLVLSQPIEISDSATIFSASNVFGDGIDSIRIVPMLNNANLTEAVTILDTRKTS